MKKSQGCFSGIMAMAVALVLTSMGPEAALGAKANDRASTLPDGVVNINTATVAQLTLLPGIGTSKAEAIVAFRTKHEFKKVEDLARVKGIGRKTVRKLQDLLTVSGETTLVKKPQQSK